MVFAKLTTQLNSNMHIYYAFGTHIHYHQQPLIYSLFGRHILFSVFMLITLKAWHTCVHILFVWQTYWNLYTHVYMYPLFSRHILFSVWIPITLGTVYMCIKPRKCYVDSLKYFTFVCLICSFTPNLFWIHCLAVIFVFFFANAYHIFPASHKHFTFGRPYCFFHICDQLWIPCLADVFLFPYLCQYLLKLYMHVHIQKVLVPMKCEFDSLK